MKILNVRGFALGLKTVLPFVTDDETRPHLDMVQITCEDGALLIAATDGHTLAEVRLHRGSYEGPNMVCTLHPSDAAILAVSAAKALELEMGRTDKIDAGGIRESIEWRVDRNTVWTRQGREKFPPYRKIMDIEPDEKRAQAKELETGIDAHYLIRAAHAMKVFGVKSDTRRWQKRDLKCFHPDLHISTDPKHPFRFTLDNFDLNARLTVLVMPRCK